MSRCFPYPPPGYTVTRGSGEALVESIKLQKERQKAKEQRKEEKRIEKKEKRKDKKDKKEKNKEKKDKTHQKDQKCQNSSKFDVALGHGGKKFWADTKGELLQRESGAELLETSSLTEEQGQPVCLRVPSSSSDSTENSNKRKRQSAPTDAARGHGKVIRIRLSSKGQNQSNEQQNVCSTSGRIDLPSQGKADIVSSEQQNVYSTSVRIDLASQGKADIVSNEQQKVCSTSGRILLPSQSKADIDVRRSSADLRCASEGTGNIAQGLAFRTVGEQVCSTSQQNEATAAAGRARIPSMTKMQRVELLYKNLTENWVPPQFQDASCEPEDLDWLFQGKNQLKNAPKRQISANNGMSCSGSSELFPCAKHLQEVDVFALPFTVPF